MPVPSQIAGLLIARRRNRWAGIGGGELRPG
eukprot:CAMPEP_0119502112 /NCGR_PEP_ID=MMETSP1344-20130328/23696_1 /TAXON_ID=236787 /ORGANISM="Florenciella parvula, Strain CCMP2471" /LENGTH=30 /DNA_ID= /DNA_START= /DNA_END= /DNA_ORIENTATION=